MDGVMHSTHFMFVNDQGTAAVIDAMFSPELGTEDDVRESLAGAQQFVRGMTGDDSFRPMTVDEMKAHARKIAEKQSMILMDDDAEEANENDFPLDEEAL